MTVELCIVAALFFAGGVALGGLIFWPIGRDMQLDELKEQWAEGERDGSLWGVSFLPLSGDDTEHSVDPSWGNR